MIAGLIVASLDEVVRMATVLDAEEDCDIIKATQATVLEPTEDVADDD